MPYSFRALRILRKFRDAARNRQLVEISHCVSDEWRPSIYAECPGLGKLYDIGPRGLPAREARFRRVTRPPGPMSYSFSLP